MDRQKLTDRAWLLYQQLCDHGWTEDAEDIMLAHNASEDDSDPDEGFFSTMSDKDVVEAIRDLQARLDLAESESIDTYELELSRPQYEILVRALSIFRNSSSVDNRNRKDVDAILRQLV